MRKREYKETGIVRATSDGLTVLRRIEVFEEEYGAILNICIADVPGRKKMEFLPTKRQARAIARALLEWADSERR
jgi:hypothetical protein